MGWAEKSLVYSDPFNHRIIIVDHKKDLVASCGNLNQSGFGTHDTGQGLNAPYDVKVVGDYTGITPPFGDGEDERHDNEGNDEQ